jgi:molecular chaperone GrpE
MNPSRIPVSDEDGLHAGADSAAPDKGDASGLADRSAAGGGVSQPSGRAAGGPDTATAETPRPPAGEAALRDQLLRLAAEFDNFRKREARERTEAWSRAKADLIEKLLPALDDLRRVAHPDAAEAPPGSPVRALLEGVELVERKLWQTLEREGLQEIAAEGVFDPAQHEAILTQPTADARLDGRIAHVVEPGYRLGDRLLRPARVVVWKLSR